MDIVLSRKWIGDYGFACIGRASGRSNEERDRWCLYGWVSDPKIKHNACTKPMVRTQNITLSSIWPSVFFFTKQINKQSQTKFEQHDQIEAPIE